MTGMELPSWSLYNGLSVLMFGFPASNWTSDEWSMSAPVTPLKTPTEYVIGALVPSVGRPIASRNTGIITTLVSNTFVSTSPGS